MQQSQWLQECQKSQKAAPRNPQYEEWGLYRVPMAIKMVEAAGSRDELKVKKDRKVKPLSRLGEYAFPVWGTEGYVENVAQTSNKKLYNFKK